MAVLVPELTPVGDPEAVVEAFAGSVDLAGGSIDSVFANAGRGGSGAGFLDTSLDEWRAVFAVNLDSVFVLFQAAARHMIERGEGGSLVAVSSTSAIHGAANNEAYGSSKTALRTAMLLAYAKRCAGAPSSST